MAAAAAAASKFVGLHSTRMDWLCRAAWPPFERNSAGLEAGNIRELNRELKFNQTRGKNVLDQKSELKKALERLEAGKRRKEIELERLGRRTSLELRLEERAQRLAAGTEEEQSANMLTN